MKKRLLLLFFLTSLAAMSVAQTQHCPEYNQILRNLQRVYSNNLLDSALLQVRYLRACTPNDQILADEWTLKIFNRIKEQNLEAKAAQKRAEASEKKTNAALNRTTRLSSYFNFGNEDAGWAYQNGRFAVIDREGNRLTDYIYSTPDTFANGIALANVNGQFVFLNHKGKEITKRYDFVAQQSNDCYLVGSGKRDYGEEGFKETNSICPSDFMSAKLTKDKMIELNEHPYSIKLNEHLFLAPTKDGLWVRLNEKGRQTGYTSYKEVSNYCGSNGGVVAVKVDSLWGFIDSLENWVVRPQFKEIAPFWEVVDATKRDSLRGIIDSLINLVIPFECDCYNVYASNDNNLTPSRKDSLWGYVDKLGHWRIQPQYSEANSFENGVAKVGLREKGDKWYIHKYGVIDTTGKIIIPIKYIDILLVLKNGLAWVHDEGLSLVDSVGRKLDSIPGRGPVTYYFFQNEFDRLIIRSKSGDPTSLVFSDGRLVHWPPNEGIKFYGREFNKIEFAIKKNGAWHYADSTKIYDLEIHLWDSIYFGQNGIARVCKDSLWGVTDSIGQLIVETQFKHISDFENGLARIQSAKDTLLWGVVNTAGQIIVEPKYEEVDIDYWGNSIAVRKGNLWGYININEGIYIKPQFSKIYTENYEGTLAIVLIDSLWGRIDTAGHIIMENEIDKPHITMENDMNEQDIIEPERIDEIPGVVSSIPFGDGLQRFHVGNLWGIHDSTGQVLLEPQFKSISAFNQGLAEVQKDSLWGYIDFSGNIVVEPQFNEIYGFAHGLAPVRKDSLWGYIDTTGRVVVEPQFNGTYAFRCGLAPIQKGKLQGYIDTTGHVLITPQFDFVYSFKNNIAWVKKNALWGLLGTTGDFLIEPQYREITPFANGLMAVQKDSLWGFIDSLGHILLEPEFDEVPKCGEAWSTATVRGTGKYTNLYCQSDMKIKIQSAFIPIRKGNQLGLVDKTGQVVLPIHFSRIEAFEDGFAGVEQSKKKGLIDLQFNLVLPCEYSDLRRVSVHNYMTENNGRYGLFNHKYKVFIPAEYEKLGLPGEEFGWLRAKKNGKWGWVDQHGAVKIPFRYDASRPFKNGKAWVLQEPNDDFFEINREGKMIVGR